MNQLATARESDRDLGFQARLMALCSLPRSNPGHRKEYVRRNGPCSAEACVRAASVSRYREQALNRYDQDCAPQEEHEIRDDPGHQLPDVRDRSDGVYRYDQRDRR